jgi:broad specificity phosphatase PhoE
MNGTLPLFQELEPPPSPAGSDGQPGSERPQQQPGAPPAARPAAGERHLEAAWRLSRAIRRFPERSAEQTRTGLAICHHLQALLAQAAQDPPR